MRKYEHCCYWLLSQQYLNLFTNNFLHILFILRILFLFVTIIYGAYFLIFENFNNYLKIRIGLMIKNSGLNIILNVYKLNKNYVKTFKFHTIKQ